eukprot:TRINITY_DN6365_c0_g1_i1.p1 TRINITY_DN6365_c0_g1~~TRINITY_DN6365_c0_g1_i1.p1  ORF type:complete len:539 (-),score=72.17 TRINITY_DN6365_c0_g1_i1:323-1939(-)
MHQCDSKQGSVSVASILLHPRLFGLAFCLLAQDGSSQVGRVPSIDVGKESEALAQQIELCSLMINETSGTTCSYTRWIDLTVEASTVFDVAIGRSFATVDTQTWCDDFWTVNGLGGFCDFGNSTNISSLPECGKLAVMLRNVSCTDVSETVAQTVHEDLSFLKKHFGFDIHVRFDPIQLLWLIVAVPAACACSVFIFRRRVQQTINDSLEPVEPPQDLTLGTIERDRDKLGEFTRIRKPVIRKDANPSRPKVKIVVREMPERRPLGLEMQETMVVRVHPLGARWGWKEGDIVRVVAGVPVSTFEELWDRIQIERDRLPITFIVERNGEHAVDLEAAEFVTQQGRMAFEGRKGSRSRLGSRSSRQQSKVSSISTKSPLGSPMSGHSRTASKLDAPAAVDFSLDSLIRTTFVPGVADPPEPEQGPPVDAAFLKSVAEGTEGPNAANLASALARWAAQPESDSGEEDEESREEDVTLTSPEIPEWRRIRMAPPRIDQVFEKTQDISGEAVQVLTRTQRVGLRQEVRWVRDAWGRNVMKVVN